MAEVMSEPARAEDRVDSCAASSTAMEVLDDEHFDGVLKVLHHAKKGRLITRHGIFEVRPTPSTSADYLFGLELEEPIKHPLEALHVDELELLFGDAVFSLEGRTVVVEEGQLLVRRPHRLFSKGLASVVVSPGQVRLRWTVGRLKVRTEVLELSIDEIAVEGAGPSLIPGVGRSATIEFYEYGQRNPVEVDCWVDVRRGNPRPECAHLMLTVSEEDHPELVRIYRILRFPQLAERGALDSEDVVDLFVRSRYLSLRETDSASPSEAWCCPDFAGGLSIDTVYVADDGAALGHVSVTRAYSKTWLGHQLATLKGHPESAMCRQALYRHFACAPLLSDGENCYLLGYFDRSLRWHRLFFESFVDWVGDERQSVVFGFDRFEPTPTNTFRLPPPHADPVEIRELYPEEASAAVELLRAQLPDLAMRAQDIDEKHLVINPLHPEYERLGVERARYALALVVDEELVGVALCETGSRHLSLFNLLNLGQVFISTEHEVSRDARAMLLRAVRRFYKRLGVVDPVLVAPPGTFDYPSDAGLQCEETMGCIIWSGQSLLQYQSFISYCFAKIKTSSLVGESQSNAVRGVLRGGTRQQIPETTLSSAR